MQQALVEGTECDVLQKQYHLHRGCEGSRILLDIEPGSNKSVWIVSASLGQSQDSSGQKTSAFSSVKYKYTYMYLLWSIYLLHWPAEQGLDGVTVKTLDCLLGWTSEKGSLISQFVCWSGVMNEQVDREVCSQVLWSYSAFFFLFNRHVTSFHRRPAVRETGLQESNIIILLCLSKGRD